VRWVKFTVTNVNLFFINMDSTKVSAFMNHCEFVKLKQQFEWLIRLKFISRRVAKLQPLWVLATIEKSKGILSSAEPIYLLRKTAVLVYDLWQMQASITIIYWLFKNIMFVWNIQVVISHFTVYLRYVYNKNKVMKLKLTLLVCRVVIPWQTHTLMHLILFLYSMYSYYILHITLSEPGYGHNFAVINAKDKGS
jgi:hypothetical protein